jgi:hypothetical protein
MYRKIKKIQKDIYVAIDEKELEVGFDTEIVQTVLLYFNGLPSSKELIFEIPLGMKKEYIDDKYHFDASHITTQEEIINACLDVGERIYEEKGETLSRYSSIKADSRLHYIPMIDLQHV